MTAWPPFAELVPHSGPMVLLDELSAWSPGTAECRVKIRPRAPFVVEGRVDSSVTLEYMAQAVAACFGYEARLDGGTIRVGMLIGCKTFTAYDACLDVGDDVTVRVERARGNEIISHFACRLYRAGELFSEALLTLYHADAPPEDARGESG